MGPPNMLQISSAPLACIQVAISVAPLLPISLQAVPAATYGMLQSAHTVPAYSCADHTA
jgi:hypothetical protein